MAKLGEICAFQSGGTPSKNKPEYFGGKIPWISTTALNGGKINEADAVAWITPKAIRESAAKIVPANSIMVGTRVGIGKVAINTVEMSTSQDVISLINIDEDKWYKPYLCKLLLSKKDYFNSQARGATIKGIKIDVVANIDVPEIDYATQRKVAATLNKIDTLISLRKQQLAKLDELVKARFVEMFGDPVNNPMNYPKSQLGKVCDVRDGTHDSPEYYDVGYPLVTSKNVTGGKIDLSECNLISEDDYKKICERSKVDRGDIIMPMIGTVGKPVIVNAEPMFAIKNVALIKFTPDSLVTNIYIKTLLESDYFDRAVLDKIRGGTQKFIALGDIRKLEIILPDLKYQQCFSAFVERVNQQKQTVQQSLEKLEMMKKALMQEYFG